MVSESVYRQTYRLFEYQAAPGLALKGFEEKSYTPKSVSRKINSLKTFYSFLKKENLITDDISQEITHPKIDVRAPRALKNVEYRALRDACRSDKRLFAIVELLLQTGMRIGELARIRIEDLQFNQAGIGKINIPAFEKEPQNKVPFKPITQEDHKRYLYQREREKEKTQVVFITTT